MWPTQYSRIKNSLTGNCGFPVRLFFDNDRNQAHICGDSAVIHSERRFWVLFMNKAIDLEAQYDKIYRYCYFKLHSKEAAEDITQETFLRFWQSEGYQEKGKSLAYLYTIARNLCINEFRKALGEGGPRETHFADTKMEDRHRGNHGEDKTEDVLLSKILLRQALLELTEEEREILLLRYVNEVPVSVVGRMLGISRFTVRRRTLSALQQLRKLLKEEDFYES